jgi:hypothetical protein
LPKEIGRRGVLVEGAGLIPLDQTRIKLREMSWRFSKRWSVSPAKNS